MAGGAPLLNCKVYVGGLNLSGDSNSLNLQNGAEMLDDTTFREVSQGTTRSFRPGFKTIELGGNIFYNPDNDEIQFSQIGIVNQVVSLAPIGEVEGDRTFFFRGVRGTYNPMSGELGTIIQAQLHARASRSPLVRAQLMTRGTKTVTANSTGINMGSAAGKMIYSALHVVSPLTPGGGGEQIVGTIESDDNSGFTTATVRLTHATMTQDGSDWQELLVGAGITDNWWRARWTISGTSPSFGIYWSFGILAP